MTIRLATPLRTWNARRELHRQRLRADAELRSSRLASPRLAWRIHELVGDEHRLELGRSLIGALHVVDERRLPSASPLDRVAIRCCRPELLALGSRLCDVDRPVAARGVLLVEELLSDTAGPFYGSSDPANLRASIDRSLAALDGEV
jgi:hypothetical protein